MLQRDVSDPRLATVTVAAVKVSRDLSHAKVYVTFLEPDSEQVASGMQALKHAAGFLHDTTVSRGLHLDALIDKAVEEDRRREEPPAKQEDI